MAGHSSRLYKESFTKQGEEKKESCFGKIFIFNFFNNILNLTRLLFYFRGTARLDALFFYF